MHKIRAPSCQISVDLPYLPAWLPVVALASGACQLSVPNGWTRLLNLSWRISSAVTTQPKSLRTMVGNPSSSVDVRCRGYCRPARRLDNICTRREHSAARCLWIAIAASVLVCCCPALRRIPAFGAEWLNAFIQFALADVDYGDGTIEVSEHDCRVLVIFHTFVAFKADEYVGWLNVEMSNAIQVFGRSTMSHVHRHHFGRLEALVSRRCHFWYPTLCRSEAVQIVP